MPTITIYDSPDDYPGVFVARLFSGTLPTDTFCLSPTLAPARDWAVDHLARLGVGAVAIPRRDLDHLSVIETWL